MTRRDKRGFCIGNNCNKRTSNIDIMMCDKCCDKQFEDCD